MSTTTASTPIDTPAAPTMIWTAANVHPDDQVKIREFLKRHDLPEPRDDVLHCTIMYSKLQPGIKAIETYDEPIEAKHKGWKLNVNNPGDDISKVGGVLVLKLDSPGLQQRYDEEMSVDGATTDFPVYAAHISLKGVWFEDEDKKYIENRCSLCEIENTVNCADAERDLENCACAMYFDNCIDMPLIDFPIRFVGEQKEIW
jgi:hypothetical protein